MSKNKDEKQYIESFLEMLKNCMTIVIATKRHNCLNCKHCFSVYTIKGYNLFYCVRKDDLIKMKDLRKSNKCEDYEKGR